MNFELKTKRLLIRRAKEDDLIHFVPLFFNEEIIYYYIPEEIQLQSKQEVIDYLSDWDDDESCFLFTCLENDEIVGFFSLENFSNKQKHTECGIAIINQDDYGKGFATEIIRAMINYLFYNLNLHRIYIRYIEGNQPSKHLFEKMNFKHEGTLREHIRRGNRYLDLHFMSVLRKEW